jgi:LmbE family N-acetylglucosaminyl deacetylase
MNGETLVRAAGWALGRGEELEGPVVAVSVHLDDAVFSLGAALSRAVRRGARVTVLTVLANDVHADAPAGEWDARAGFRTVREAAEARRAEDRRACALIGARAAWLPFGDMTYGRGASDDEVATAVHAHVDDAATVLVPGFPLAHPDHRWLAGLLDGLAAPWIGRYVEQPYAIWSPSAGADGREWRPLAAGVRDRFAKLRACRTYRSQLRLLDPGVVYRMTRNEAGHGGELVVWD